MNRKESENMSLVGIMRVSEGFVAFGDSRSTLQDTSGTPYADERGLQKVFHGDNFLLATYGNNQCVKNNQLRCLQDTIQEVLKDRHNNIDRFLKELHDSLHESYENLKVDYQFIIGVSCDDGKYIQLVTLNKKGIIYGEKNYGISMIYNTSACTPTGLIPLDTWNLKESVMAAQMFVRYVMDLGNTFLSYNYVGGDIRVMSMDNNGRVEQYLNGQLVED